MNIDLSKIPDKDLLDEIQRRNLNLEGLKVLSLNKNGITIKDIVIVYGMLWSAGSFRFAPHIKKPDGTIEFAYHSDALDYEDWVDILPSFYESEECIFEYMTPDLDQALNQLKALGLESKRDDDFFAY